jgi:hypothetical protein
MAAPRYIGRVLGKFKQIVAAVVATADSIVATDSSGRIDISFLPVGVGAEVVVCTTSENIAAGAFVNLYNNGGTLTARNADATTTGKPAMGFVLAATLSGANATVYFTSNTNTAMSGLTIGAEYWLDKTTPGGVVVAASAPTSAGNGNQYLGVALSATSMSVNIEEMVEMA